MSEFEHAKKIYNNQKALIKDLIISALVLSCAFATLLGLETTWTVTLIWISIVSVVALLVGMWDVINPDTSEEEPSICDFNRYPLQYFCPILLIMGITAVFSQLPNTASDSGAFLNSLQSVALMVSALLAGAMILLSTWLGTALATCMLPTKSTEAS